MGQDKDKIDFWHFSSWLIKDIFWFLKWKYLAAIMVIPTLGLTIYMLIKSKQLISVNTIFSSWVFMNAFWMLHELHGMPLYLAKIFMVSGLSSLLLYVIKNNYFKK